MDFVSWILANQSLRKKFSIAKRIPVGLEAERKENKGQIQRNPCCGITRLLCVVVDDFLILRAFPLTYFACS